MEINFIINSYKYLLVAVLFCCSYQAKAQTFNLVPNPSFEVYDTCPYSNLGSQIYLAIPWTGPQVNSTDYLNACSPVFGVPIAGINYQYARTGVAYAGIWTKEGTNYREYLQALLLDTLIAGHCYFVSFYANLINSVPFGSNNVAAYLSYHADSIWNIPSWMSKVLNYTPQIVKPGNPIITDTLNWTQVASIYTATGGEKYITIGNFYPDSATLGTGGYYYIDDVAVIEAKAYAGKDTIINKGDSVWLGLDTITGVACTWYVNNDIIKQNNGGLWIKPTQTTTYILKTIVCGITTYDTVVVSVKATGVEQLKNRSSQIISYPNPTSNSTSIILTKSVTNATIKLISVIGETLLEKINQTGNQFNLDMTQQTQGIYFIEVQQDECIWRTKVVKQ